MSKPFIVVDTNIFISAVLLNSKNVVLALEKARYKFRILSSEKTFEELVRNFYKPKFAKYAKYHDIATERRDIADSLYVIVTTI